MNIQEEYQSSPNISGTGLATTALHRTNTNTPAVLVDVKKCAYCDLHTPRDSLSPRTRADLLKSGLAEHELTSDEALKRAQKFRMKRTRKILAERRNAPPVVSVPCIPRDRLDEVRRRVFGPDDQEITEKTALVDQVMQYWLLKRYARNGRPLLRRLLMSATVKKANAASSHTTPIKEKPVKEEITPSKKELVLLTYF